MRPANAAEARVLAEANDFAAAEDAETCAARRAPGFPKWLPCPRCDRPYPATSAAHRLCSLCRDRHVTSRVTPNANVLGPVADAGTSTPGRECYFPILQSQSMLIT